MQCSLLSRALDLAEKLLRERGLAMPYHLFINADNTTRETKNSHVAKYCAYLLTIGRFKGIQIGFFRVGHTHNYQDQRFSVLRSILAAAPTLEDLEAKCWLSNSYKLWSVYYSQRLLWVALF